MDVGMALVYALADRMMFNELREAGMEPGTPQWDQCVKAWRRDLLEAAATLAERHPPSGSSTPWVPKIVPRDEAPE